MARTGWTARRRQLHALHSDREKPLVPVSGCLSPEAVLTVEGRVRAGVYSSRVTSHHPRGLVSFFGLAVAPMRVRAAA